MRLATALSMVLTLTGAFAAHAQTSTVVLPGTSAGTILRDWLDAFNRGDSLRLDAYQPQFEPGRLDGTTLRHQTGGLDLVAIELSEPRHIEVTIRERRGPRFASLVLTTPSDGSMNVATLRLAWVEPNASTATTRMDVATRARVITDAVAQLERSYVFPDVAKQAGDSLRKRLERGAYDAYTSGLGFATRLHDDLRDITRDKHVFLQYAVPVPTPVLTGAEFRAQQIAKLEASNCGFVKAEVLPDNIGYLEFNKFMDAKVCAPTAAAAMTFLATTRALIVDLRENTGGNPAMVTYLSSYLFTERTHLNSLWTRVNGQTVDFWTQDDVPGRKFGEEKPVYVLTAARTISAAEEFAYNLKSRKRAVIVGERTAGAAHPVASIRIDGRFTVGVPVARAINPITKTNWEGVGVEPDVKAPESEALATVLKLIANKPRS